MESVRMVLMASWSSSSWVMLVLRQLSPRAQRGAFDWCSERSLAALGMTAVVASRSRRLLDMPAKLIAHGREQLVGKIRLAARAEPLVERRRQDMRRHALVDRRLDRPAALAGIGHPAGELGQVRILDQRRGLQVEQPRGNDAAAPP